MQKTEVQGDWGTRHWGTRRLGYRRPGAEKLGYRESGCKGLGAGRVQGDQGTGHQVQSTWRGLVKRLQAEMGPVHCVLTSEHGLAWRVAGSQ